MQKLCETGNYYFLRAFTLNYINLKYISSDGADFMEEVSTSFVFFESVKQNISYFCYLVLGSRALEI